MKTPMIHLAVILGALAVGSVSAWNATRLYYVAEIADIRQAHAREALATAEAARERQANAQTRGNAITNRLATTDATRQTQTQETSREIHRATAGRPCLGSTIVRLLNAPATGSEPGAVSETAGQPVAADVTFATDTDVGEWINGAQSQYGTCRDRLQALIDWHQEETQ